MQHGSWGGIYEVPSNYSFTNTDSSQTATLVERFSYWRTGNGSLQHIMPWLTSDTYALLRAHNNTDATSSWAGTVVCNCADFTWSPYTSWYTDDSTDIATTAEMTTEGATTAEFTTEEFTTEEFTTEEFTTEEFTTEGGGSGSSRRRRAADTMREGDEEFDGFKYVYQIGESRIGSSRQKRSSSGTDLSTVTNFTVWYWLKEDHHGKYRNVYLMATFDQYLQIPILP